MIESATTQWRRAAQSGVPILFRKCSEEEIVAAEKILKVRLPPSYVELVLTLGAPALDLTPPTISREVASNLPYAMLRPDEIVVATHELRSEIDPDMFEAAESLPRVRAQLANALFFQYGSNAGEGHVFLVDTADAHGEMNVADFSHDYIEELDWSESSSVRWPSLAVSTAEVLRQLQEYREKACP